MPPTHSMSEDKGDESAGSFALVMATFLPRMKIWGLSKRAGQLLCYRKICEKFLTPAVSHDPRAF